MQGWDHLEVKRAKLRHAQRVALLGLAGTLVLEGRHGVFLGV